MVVRILACGSTEKVGCLCLRGEYVLSGRYNMQFFPLKLIVQTKIFNMVAI